MKGLDKEIEREFSSLIDTADNEEMIYDAKNWGGEDYNDNFRNDFIIRHSVNLCESFVAQAVQEALAKHDKELVERILNYFDGTVPYPQREVEEVIDLIKEKKWVDRNNYITKMPNGTFRLTSVWPKSWHTPYLNATCQRKDLEL